MEATEDLLAALEAQGEALAAEMRAHTAMAPHGSLCMWLHPQPACGINQARKHAG